MSIKVLGWSGFAFLGAGLLILLFGPVEWRSIGCGSLLTAVTVYAIGLWTVVRHIAAIRRRATEMLSRAADEMERRKR